MSELPQGSIIADPLSENREWPEMTDAKFFSANTIIAQTAETETTEDAALEEFLAPPVRSDLGRLQNIRPEHKKINLDINVGTEHLQRRVTVGTLGRLPVSTVVLLGVGQVNAPKYNCIRGNKRRQEFLLKMVNKGRSETDQVTPETLDGYLEAAAEEGHITRIGKVRWQLTEAGMSSLLQDDELKKRLKNPGSI